MISGSVTAPSRRILRARKSPSASSPSAPARSSHRPERPCMKTKAARAIVVEPPVVSEESPMNPQNVLKLRSATKYESSSLPARRRQTNPIARTPARYATSRMRVSVDKESSQLEPLRGLERDGFEEHGPHGERAFVDVEVGGVVRAVASGGSGPDEEEAAGHAIEENGHVLSAERSRLDVHVLLAEELPGGFDHHFRHRAVVDRRAVDAPVIELRPHAGRLGGAAHDARDFLGEGPARLFREGARG